MARATANLASLAQSLADDANAAALRGDHARAAELCSQARIIADVRKLIERRRPPILSISIAGACLVLVCIAWKLPLRKSRDLNVSIRGESATIQLALARNFEMSLRGKEILLSRITAVELQSTSMPDVEGPDAWLAASGSPVVLKTLTIAAPARLELRGGPGHRILLSAYSPRLEGQLNASGGATVEVGRESEAASRKYQIPAFSAEAITFRGEGRERVPFRLELGPAPAWFWANVPVNELHFADDALQPDGTSISGSGIQKATVRLLDVNREVSLQAGDALRLELTHVNRFWIRRAVDPDCFEFNLEAKAKRVSAGPIGSEADLSPSLLESLYREKSLSLFWGAVVFLFSLFTGLLRAWKGGTT